MVGKVWTSAELEAMSPAEQDDVFDASIVTDLSEVPAEFLARVQGRLVERAGGADSPNQR